MLGCITWLYVQKYKEADEQHSMGAKRCWKQGKAYCVLLAVDADGVLVYEAGSPLNVVHSCL